MRPVRDLLVLPTGHLVSCSLDGTILLWDYTAETVVQRFIQPKKQFRCLLYNHAAKQVYAGTEEADIIVVPFALPQPVRTCIPSALSIH